jgi:hypothetical protein
VQIRVSTEDHLGAVVACFGEPEKERKIAPSAIVFAQTVVDTEYGGDTNAFIADVCQKLDIPTDRFGSYRAMVLSTARMAGAPEKMKEAANKLKTL